MSWKISFANGVDSFKTGNHELALEYFNEAIENGGQTQFIIYDSRSAVLDKLNQPKDALKDAKKTIDIAPDRWQGYTRAARLFLKSRKFASAATMADMAYERIKPEDEKRRIDIVSLKENIAIAQEQAKIAARRTRNHFVNLPAEIFTEIAGIVVDDDSAALIMLLHVCNDWRKVAWGTPFLWNTLVLARYRPHAKAKLWVERSKGKIQELHVRAEAFGGSRWLGDGLENFRWEHLRVCKTENWDLWMYLEQEGKLDALTCLGRLDIEDGTRNSAAPLSRIVQPSWPLRHLSLSGTYSPWRLQGVQHESLHSLILRDLRDAGCISAVLEQNTLLETLIVVCSSSHNMTDLSKDPPKRLSHLKRLELTNVSRSMQKVFKIEMPELRALHIYQIFPPIDVAMNSLLFNRSVHLTELIIRSSTINDPKLVISVLQLSLSLQTLEFSGVCDGVDKVIEALGNSFAHGTSQIPLSTDTLPTNTSPRFMCPQLTNVNFSRCPCIRTGPLVRLVKSRLPPSPTADASSDQEFPYKSITSLIVDGCDYVEVEWLPWFREKVQTFSCIYLSKKAARYKR